MAKTEIWIGTIEISWFEQETPTVFQPVFTVVTTWAASPEVSGKVRPKGATDGRCWTLNGGISGSPPSNLHRALLVPQTDPSPQTLVRQRRLNSYRKFVLAPPIRGLTNRATTGLSSSN